MGEYLSPASHVSRDIEPELTEIYGISRWFGLFRKKKTTKCGIKQLTINYSVYTFIMVFLDENLIGGFLFCVLFANTVIRASEMIV